MGSFLGTQWPKSSQVCPSEPQSLSCPTLLALKTLTACQGTSGPEVGEHWWALPQALHSEEPLVG